MSESDTPLLVIPYKVEWWDQNDLTLKEHKVRVEISPIEALNNNDLDEILKDTLQEYDGAILFQAEKFTIVDKDGSRNPVHGGSMIGHLSLFEMLRMSEKHLNKRF